MEFQRSQAKEGSNSAMTQQHQSEVASLKERMEAEYIAATRGLSGLAYGMPQHQFITQKMENMQYCLQQLQHLVGDEETKRIVLAMGNEGS